MADTTPTQAPQAEPPAEGELVALAGIAIFFHWLEELLNILNGPILLFGAGVALVDLLTDGALSADAAWVVIAWGTSQALGIDTQLLGAFARVARCFRQGRYWKMLGWLLLGAVLGYAAWQAGDVYAIQQSQHITEAQALAQLGMSPEVWLGWRAFLGVGLVALSGITRYTAPGKRKPNTEEEKAALERELELEPLRQAVRQQRATGIAALGRATIAAARGETPRPPTGGGSPAGKKAPTSEQATQGVITAGEPGIIPLPAPRQRRAAARGSNARSKPKGKARESAEAKARAAWRPGMTVGELERAAGIGKSAASKWRQTLQAEADRAEAEGRAQ